MPVPRYAEEGEHLGEATQKALEILGLGPESRKSKTYLTDAEMAFILMKVRAKRRLVINALRDAHAKHNDRPVYEEGEDGEPVEVGREPDVLADREIIGLYTSAQFWNDVHQEFVDHMASVEGFSVNAVSGLEDEERRKTPDSTAGSNDRDDNRF